MFIIPAVVFAFAFVLLKAARNRFVLLHMALVLAWCWWTFPSMKYSVWHPYYPQFWLETHLVVVNLVTFFAYGWDKRASMRFKDRIPERTLHLLALIGGTPGAFIGSKLFRHKTSKASFRKRFWLIVIIQILLLWMVFIPAHRNALLAMIGL